MPQCGWCLARAGSGGKSEADDAGEKESISAAVQPRLGIGRQVRPGKADRDGKTPCSRFDAWEAAMRESDSREPQAGPRSFSSGKSVSFAGSGASVEPSRGGFRDGGRDGGGLAVRRRPIPPKLYRIGEVMEYSGVSRQTIHNYTTMGLLRESKWTPGGHRLYDEFVFARLDEIARLKARRMSMQDIRRHFAQLDNENT